MLEKLPKEIILEILQYLSFTELNNVSQTSKSLFSMATDPSLWKNFEFEDFDIKEMQVPLSSVLALPRFQKLTRFSVPSSRNKIRVESTLLPTKQIEEHISEVLVDLERKEFNKIMENLQNMNLQVFALGRIPFGRSHRG